MYIRRVVLILTIILFVNLCVTLGGDKESKKHLFSTWENMEPDKCASAWLIKRFVDKEAKFKFFTRGELITEGIAFDTPDAELRRYHRMSTFEKILKKYKIKDKKLEKIGKVIHEIEVNFWTHRWSKEARELRADILRIIRTARKPKECFEKSFKYFDELYKRIKTEQIESSQK